MNKYGHFSEKADTLHHDVGFMWNLTAGANFRFTGNQKSKNRFYIANAFLNKIE